MIEELFILFQFVRIFTSDNAGVLTSGALVLVIGYSLVKLWWGRGK